MSAAQPLFLNKLYSESMDLLEEAHNYLSYHPSARQALRQPNVWDAVFVNLQAMRLTSRMTQAMAWLLAQRAVQTGEMTLHQACGGDFSLGAEDICTDLDGHNDNRVPPSMQKLLERSHGIYMRVLRLDQAARAKISA